MKIDDKQLRKSLIEILKYLIILVIIVIGTRFVLRPGIVRGNSMVPTYQDGDYMGIYLLDNDFTRDEVVSFTYEQPQVDYLTGLMGEEYAIQQGKNSQLGEAHIKRIIGLPGDKITITDDGTNNQIYVNDQMLYEHPRLVPAQEYILNPDEYFLIGDNLMVSLDSRYHGPVNKKQINGSIVGRINLNFWGNNESGNN